MLVLELLSGSLREDALDLFHNPGIPSNVNLLADSDAFDVDLINIGKSVGA